MTRTWPPCKHTNNRPSGANVIAVGFDKPDATSASEKLGGTVAASARSRHNTIKSSTRTALRNGLFIGSPGGRLEQGPYQTSSVENRRAERSPGRNCRA